MAGRLVGHLTRMQCLIQTYFPLRRLSGTFCTWTLPFSVLDKATKHSRLRNSIQYAQSTGLIWISNRMCRRARQRHTGRSYHLGRHGPNQCQEQNVYQTGPRNGTQARKLAWLHWGLNHSYRTSNQHRSEKDLPMYSTVYEN